MEISKILIVIEHEPSDKDLDGSPTPGAIVGIRANLPPRYLDVVICEAEVTERNEHGGAVALQWDSDHPRGDVPFLIPFEPSLYEDGEYTPQREHEEDQPQEWRVMFWHHGSMTSALVLKAPDVIVAAQRVIAEFPTCRIVEVEQAWLEQGHPLTYLDENEIILPVGGPRVQRGPDTKQ